MSQNQLGTMIREYNLRSVWPHEASNFTKWLIKPENLKLLSDTINIQIEYEENESRIGDFRADIYAKEYTTGKNIIIENQLEDTDHEHLGKIITYASGKEASIIIWIVKYARDEFKKSIEWLNNHTDEQTMFFLLEIELWKIENSKLAPKFNIVESPNNWAKQQKINDNLSDKEILNLNFWSEFKDYCENNEDTRRIFTFRTPQPHYWYDLAVGKGNIFIRLTMSIQKKEITSGIYIKNSGDLNDILDDKKLDFESEIKTNLTINKGNFDTRIFARNNIDVTDTKNWQDCFKWLSEKSLIFYKLTQEL